jgi:hypothetical protein
VNVLEGGWGGTYRLHTVGTGFGAVGPGI